MPFNTYETRWFFEGHDSERLRHWFETTAPFPKDTDVGSPPRQGRAGDAPDVYALLPGHTDMGIKWREGLLQIKGRVAACGIQRFGRGHEGRVERWAKWSYGELPEAWRRLFLSGERELPTVAVEKTRRMRKLSLDAFDDSVREVGAGTPIDRGLAIELTDVGVDDCSWCTLGFEAWPDDSAMPTAFTHAVSIFLEDLEQLELTASDSLSYPAWLERITATDRHA